MGGGVVLPLGLVEPGVEDVQLAGRLPAGGRGDAEGVAGVVNRFLGILVGFGEAGELVEGEAGGVDVVGV